VSIVPALDLRPASSDVEIAHVPANVEAEQALLGAVLYDNGALELLDVELEAHHFYEPFHQRLFKSISAALRAGFNAEPIVLAEEFRRDPAFLELGGVRYLADLVDRAPPAVNATEYARAVYELANLRALIRISDAIGAAARQTTRTEDGDAWTSATIIEGAEKDLLSIQVTGRGRAGAELVDLADAAQGVIAYVQDRTRPMGAKTGLNPVDLQLGPLMPGDLILLAGRPSMGKSAVGLATTLNVAAPQLADYLNGLEYDGRPPRGVMEFHAEMSVDKAGGGQVARRHLANIGYGLYGNKFPTYKQLRDKSVSVDQLEMLKNAAGNLIGVPLRSVKRTGMKLSALRAVARRQIAAWDRAGVEPGLLIIDHVGLLRPDGRVSGRYEAQTEIAIGAKELADELQIPVMALVQLSRDIERRDDKRPMLSDLRDSGAWEENADIAAFVYRDAYYAAREADVDMDADAVAWAKLDQRRRSKLIEIIFGKVREGEAGGSAEVWGALGWNAIRGHEPDAVGGLL
jgi:replicative DNA helicase